MKLYSGWELLKETFNQWYDDNSMQLAAAVAFYTVFSFAPVLIILIAVASIVFGKGARTEVVTQLHSLVGQSGARMIQTVLDHAQPAASIATILGAIALLFGATAVFAALQGALNRIWGVMVKPGRTVRLFFKKRLVCFVMILGFGGLLMTSVIIGTVVTTISTYLKGAIPIPVLLLELGQFSVSFVMATVLFAVIYKVLPDVKIAWADVWTGAAVTSLLFNLGKLLIAVYLARSTIGTAYGAAGSFAVFIVWIYYSAQVFFFGAEFTQVYARRRGKPIVPDENAVRFEISVHPYQ